MKYTKLGRTNLMVSKLSFGGIPIQRDNVENTIKVVDELEKNGINYIDTARAYTVSEEYLGVALKGRREKFIIATKTMSRDYDSMKADIQTSLDKLQTNYIDIYQIHNPKAPDVEVVFGENGAMKALLEAKSEGKIKFIGATFHGIDPFEEVLEKYSEHIDTVMFPYNIVEVHGEEILLKSQKMGIGTIAMKPLAGGNLDDYDLALKFIDKSECIDIIIPGMGNAEEVEKNLSAMDKAELNPEFTEKELKDISDIRDDLGNSFCRRCGYCAPCTVGIDIPLTLLMANYYRKYEGLKDWSMSRYEAFTANGSDCVKCGLCESRCPYDLKIMDMLDDLHIMFTEAIDASKKI